VHLARAPHVVLGLRAQDPVPQWITHVLDVDPPAHLSAPARGVWCGTRQAWQSAYALAARAAPPPAPPPPRAPTAAAPIAELRDVRVSYDTRSVLSGVDWTIRPGERWHLRGANGAGKSTLLALLSGAHPLSHAQRGGLRLFGRPRGAWDAPALRARVGQVGPELADALPRARGRSVWDVVGTGWEGAFVPLGNGGVGDVGRAERGARVQRMWEVLTALGPAAWGAYREPPPQHTRAAPPGTPPDARTLAFATTDYADLAPGERSLTLLARALVGRPPLLLLDEAWAGMDGAQVAAARAFLRSARGVGDGQAVVVVSHWEEEVPWGPGEVKRITMEGGRAVVEE
jgi:ABC-type molybdenum transport system ATPase subunit/photorepair protein PhrA